MWLSLKRATSLHLGLDPVDVNSSRQQLSEAIFLAMVEMHRFEYFLVHLH